MGHGHDHTHIRTDNERRLVWALLLTSSFLVVEVVGGVITQSLALISDAAHMLTDVAALVIALLALKIGKKSSDSIRTYGYYRFEILAAAFNAVLLFLVALYILAEAYQRLSQPASIDSTGMLVVAAIGLSVNVISMVLLTSGKESSLNLKSAYFEVVSDALGSLGVIVGALMIRFTGFSYIDSIIAVLIGLWVLPRAWVLLKESINILLEGVPKGIDLNRLKDLAQGIEGVVDLHEIHVWAITSDKINLTAHVVIAPAYESDYVLTQLRYMVREEFNILHTTFQHERGQCLDGEEGCHFGPS
ncbi:MAG: cation diffusion facilitator family transporter [Legionellaceae bacterium]